MDLIRPLGKRSIPVVVVSPQGFPQCFSRFVSATIELRDIRHGAEEVIADLIRFGRDQEEQPVLMADQDEYLLLISRNRERLAPHFRFQLADEELVEDLVDKDRFQALADRLGLPVPPAQRLKAIGSHPPAIKVSYPVVIKPLTRRDRDVPWVSVGGSSKALRVDDVNAFEITLARPRHRRP